MIPIRTAWIIEKTEKFTTSFLKVSRKEQHKMIELYSPTGLLIVNRDSLSRNGYDIHSVSLSSFVVYGAAASLCFTA